MDGCDPALSRHREHRWKPRQFAEKLRPEGGPGDARYGNNSGAYDQLGWGTLMLYQE